MQTSFLEGRAGYVYLKGCVSVTISYLSHLPTKEYIYSSNIRFNYRIPIKLCDYFLKVYQGLTIKTVRWREGRSDLSLARSGHCRWSRVFKPCLFKNVSD